MSKIRFIFLSFYVGSIGLFCSCVKFAEYSSTESLCAIPDSLRISPDKCNQRLLRWCETHCLRSTNGDTMIRASNGEWAHLDRSAIPFIFKVYKVKKPNTNIEKLIQYYSLKSKAILESNNCSSMGKWSMEDDIVRCGLDTFYSNVVPDNIVPNFVGKYNAGDPWYDASSESGLKDSYTFYIIKSGSNFILPDRELVYRWWLPGCLQHGYRSGVAVSREIDYIVFFAIAW